MWLACQPAARGGESLRDVSAGPEALDSPFRVCSECPSMLRWALWTMLENVSGINSSTALWYASRATGVVALLLMTAVHDRMRGGRR